MTQTQKILKVGTSAAVTIPKKALEMLGLSVGDHVEVEVDEKVQKVTVGRAPEINTSSPRQEHIAKLTANFIDRYRDDLEALAKK